MARINKFIADLSGISRRTADKLIADGKIEVNGRAVENGYRVKDSDRVASTDGNFTFDHMGSEKVQRVIITLNKPEGYVCSRRGQGSKTVYDLLPKQYHHLKTIGRLDKDSSGLLLLTNDGDLANELMHPKHQKEKIYHAELNKPLVLNDKNKLLQSVALSDGLSKFLMVNECSDNTYEVVLAEGRNRQIRRTFNALGYKTIRLHRIQFGQYQLGNLSSGKYISV